MNGKFENPIVDVVRLSVNDIIVTSACGGTGAQINDFDACPEEE